MPTTAARRIFDFHPVRPTRRDKVVLQQTFIKTSRAQGETAGVKRRNCVLSEDYNLPAGARTSSLPTHWATQAARDLPHPLALPIPPSTVVIGRGGRMSPRS